MDSIWNNLFERYYKSWNGIEAAYDKIAASYGVTSNVMNILTLLCKNREPMTQNELSQELYLSRQTITSVVDSLERQGLVTRSISEKDRRSRVVCLTDEGRAMRKMEMDAFGMFSTEELRAFVYGMEKLSQGLDHVLENR